MGRNNANTPKWTIVATVVALAVVATAAMVRVMTSGTKEGFDGQAPTITSRLDEMYTLATDGTPTIITVTANDPKDPSGKRLKYGYQVVSGSMTQKATATITQNNNTFTITPSKDKVGGTFALQFSVTNGTSTVYTNKAIFMLTFPSPCNTNRPFRVVVNSVSVVNQKLRRVKFTFYEYPDIPVSYEYNVSDNEPIFYARKGQKWIVHFRTNMQPCQTRVQEGETPISCYWHHGAVTSNTQDGRYHRSVRLASRTRDNKKAATIAYIAREQDPLYNAGVGSLWQVNVMNYDEYPDRIQACNIGNIGFPEPARDMKVNCAQMTDNPACYFYPGNKFYKP